MSARRVLTAALLVLAAAGCSADPAPQTAESIATAFAAAYASGDTPKACQLADGDAHAKLADAGRCDTRAYWDVAHWPVNDCTVPGRGRSFEFNTDSDIDGHRGFDIVVSDLKVVSLTTHQSSANGGGLCGIYATGSRS